MKPNWRESTSPTLVALLTGLWLLLNETIAPGQILFGAILALLLALVSARLRPARAALRRVDVAVKLALVVMLEIVRSNVAVARLVLGPRGRHVRSGFVEIPLELRDPHGLAVLAVIITSTPGTVWSGQSADGTRLSLHVLDLDDEQRWIRYVKDRFEAPLRKIFE